MQSILLTVNQISAALTQEKAEEEKKKIQPEPKKEEIKFSQQRKSHLGAGNGRRLSKPRHGSPAAQGTEGSWVLIWDSPSRLLPIPQPLAELGRGSGKQLTPCHSDNASKISQPPQQPKSLNVLKQIPGFSGLGC